MQVISHRANLNGIDLSRENQIWAIEECIGLGYVVEVDLWIVDNKFYLCHDEPQPQNIIDEVWLLKHQDNLLIHCKNKEGLVYAMETLDGEYFCHDKDRWAATSWGTLICYGNKEDIIDDNRSLIMMPEHHGITLKDIPANCGYVCTDFVEDYNVLR